VAAVALGADPGVEPWLVVGDDAPPPDLAERIVARVAAERRRSWRRRAAAVVAAVAAVAVVAVLVGGDEDPPPRGEPVTFAHLASGVTADATVAPDAAGSVVVLSATGLDPELTYALWLTPPGGGYRERVAAGTFRSDDDGEVEVTLRSALPAEDAWRVWATTPDGEVAMDTEEAEAP
jgi:anti-sigma-K factor RskA